MPSFGFGDSCIKSRYLSCFLVKLLIPEGHVRIKMPWTAGVFTMKRLMSSVTNPDSDTIVFTRLEFRERGNEKDTGT
jgi:hypothetical protein